MGYNMLWSGINNTTKKVNNGTVIIFSFNFDADILVIYHGKYNKNYSIDIIKLLIQSMW